MKKSDIALLILVVSISIVAAYFIGRLVLKDPKLSAVQVESVEKIQAEVQTPSSKVFNREAINPTVPINIGNPSGQQPFNGSE